MGEGWSCTLATMNVPAFPAMCPNAYWGNWALEHQSCCAAQPVQDDSSAITCCCFRNSPAHSAVDDRLVGDSKGGSLSLPHALKPYLGAETNGLLRYLARIRNGFSKLHMRSAPTSPFGDDATGRLAAHPRGGEGSNRRDEGSNRRCKGSDGRDEESNRLIKGSDGCCEGSRS